MNVVSLSEDLVSIGVPTYNRPTGLKRTLECLVSQTYQNIEIIISDNASSDTKVAEISREFEQKYNYIHYFKQLINQGAASNFEFVLTQAKGKYFMWAADDDEWEPEFIETCLSFFSVNTALVVPKMMVLYRNSGLTESILLPDINHSKTHFQNVNHFLDNLAPSMIYGLFRREDLIRYYEPLFFDFSDCYFLTKMLVNSEVIVLNDLPKPLYFAGIDTDQYVVKISRPKSYQKLTYSPYVIKQTQLFLFAPFSFIEKIRLIRKVLIGTCHLFLWHEKDYRTLRLRNKIKFMLVKSLIAFDNLIRYLYLERAAKPHN